jgi:23S rRNA (cytidine2498-2'-O)-methyltransferase
LTIDPRLHLAFAGRDELLGQELQAAYPQSAHRWLAPGVIASDLDPNEAALPARLAFAAQCLVRPTLMSGESVSQLARQAFEALRNALASHDGPWRLHVFTHPSEEPPVSPRRCVLVEHAIDELLHKKQRRLERTRVTNLVAPRTAGEALFQVLAVAPEVAYWSVTLPQDAPVVGGVVSRFPGGVAPVVDDLRPPSRAYRKLLEAELHMGARIGEGETCVDLGGSPGGWTFVAADRGASVVSVDRSPLRDDLMHHPRVTFLRGDAFRFAPEAPVDWLLCDVAATPSRSLEMLARWLDQGQCRRFCVTLKLKGDEAVSVVDSARRQLDGRPLRYEVRQLASNKNELTVIGSVD